MQVGECERGSPGQEREQPDPILFCDGWPANGRRLPNCNKYKAPAHRQAVANDDLINNGHVLAVGGVVLWCSHPPARQRLGAKMDTGSATAANARTCRRQAAAALPPPTLRHHMHPPITLLIMVIAPPHS